MADQVESSRPGHRSRAAVVLLVLILVAAPVGWWGVARMLGAGDDSSSDATADAEVAPDTVVMLSFSIAQIDRADESSPEVTALFESVADVTDGTADADTAAEWGRLLQAAVGAGVATIESGMAVSVYSGDEATVTIAQTAPNVLDELTVVATPHARRDGSIMLDLGLRSEKDTGWLEQWSREAGVSLGATARLDERASIEAGGAAGFVASLRHPVGRDGVLVVLVRPSVIPPATDTEAP